MKISTRGSTVGAAVLAAGVLTANHTVQAQTAVAGGDLIVLQVANRTAGTGQSVSLLEFTPNASASTLTAGQIINAPSTSGASNRFVISGSSTAGGILSLNANNTITLAGYRADIGTASATLTAAATNRVLGSLDLGTGTLNTNLNLAGSAGNTFRSAAVNDAGTTVYLSGANGVQVASATLPATPNATAVTSSSLLAGNTRQAATFGGNLFVASGSGTPGQQVFQIGTGQPTTGSQTATGLFGSNSATSQYNSFAFAREGEGTAYNGFDTIYAVNNINTAASSVKNSPIAGQGPILPPAVRLP